MVVSIIHFGIYLKDPENRKATRGVAEGRESATTAVSSETVDSRSLRQRLDEAPKLGDRLSTRPLGLGPWDALFRTNWAVLRATLKG